MKTIPNLPVIASTSASISVALIQIPIRLDTKSG